MSDHPEALPEWNEEERALWNSALDDRPPSRSLAATLQAVGVASAITTAASGAGAGVAAAKAGAGLALFKWGAVVGLAGAAIVGGGYIARHAKAPAEAPAAVANAKPEAPRSEPRAEARPTPPSVEPAPEPAAAPAPAPQAVARAAVSAARPSQPDIAREIESIDAARALVRQGRTKEALSALDGYKGKSLGVEATVLRIEALVRQGDHARATALASTFLASHPKSPYSSRIRALLRNSKSK